MSIAHTCIYDTLESCKYAKYWYGKPVVSKCKDCNRNPNNYPKTQVGTKDEMKDKISMALKDPILQQGFEIICKNLAELEKENEELKQYAKALEETDNINILHCMKVNGKLYKAKKLIKEMLSILPKENIEGIYEITEEAEQFIREVV